MRGVFNIVEKNQNQCVINARPNLCKKMLLYHGGTVFSRATDDPQFLAKTLLGVMISCKFGRPTLISKILPITKLNSPFLCE